MAAVTLAACAVEEDEIGEERYSISEPGPWHIPAETLALGATQYVENTQAGPWVGESGCGGGFLEGSQILLDYLQLYFPQIDAIYGYACRPIVGNPGSMSVHATGRALDVMIPTIGGSADNTAGDQIGNWLIENAEYIGIQYIIWDRWQWNAARDAPKDREYTGEHPHNDHLHVELSVAAAALNAPFFQNPQQPPSFISCAVVPAAGGVVDDGDTCTGFFGPAQYWRSVDGMGQGGSLLWTNAFQGDSPSNWARWGVDLEAAGRYKVEVYLVPEYAVYASTRYEVLHGGVADVVMFDQGSADSEGWYSLGAFDFAAGGGQAVSVFDNSAAAVPDEQHIVFDAVRLTPCTGSDCDGGAPPPPGEEGGGGGIAGGCSAGGSSGGVPALFLVLALGFVRRRRPR